MFSQSFEGFRNIIVFPGLSGIWEKGFLVDPIVVGETDKALDWLTISVGSNVRTGIIASSMGSGHSHTSAPEQSTSIQHSAHKRSLP